MSGVLILSTVLPFRLIRACFLWAVRAGLVSERRKNLVESAESARPTLWNSCVNLTINTFFMEVLKPRVGGVGGWATPGLQTVANAWLIGWLVGWGGGNRTQCITAPAAFSGLWMALGNLLLPIHSHWTLSHVENITYHMFIHCWCRFGGVVSSVVCGGLGSTQWPCCHLSYTGRNFMHPSIHPSTTAPPCRPCLVSLTKIIIFIYPKLLFAIFSILLFWLNCKRKKFREKKFHSDEWDTSRQEINTYIYSISLIAGLDKRRRREMWKKWQIAETTSTAIFFTFLVKRVRYG